MSAGVQRSRGEDDDDPSAPVRALRTVTPGYAGHPNREMGVIGWTMALLLVVLLLPVLPVLLALWIVSKLVSAVARWRTGGD